MSNESGGGGTASIADEYVTFIQHQLPGLDDGTYQLTVSQRVDDDKGEPINDDTLSNQYTFAVLGDRFRLRSPATTLSSVFPAPNATGEFGTVLPNAVFSLPTFPWTRYPTENEPVPNLQPGEDTDADVPTWLAVLLLDDDDVVAHPGLVLDPVTATVGDLFPPAAYAQTTLDDNYSYFDGATSTKGLEADETVADPIQVIDIPLELFVGLAPTIDDLKLTAHVRQVSLENKPIAAGASAPADPLGTFSIVVGTRLPQSNKKTRAYLVSLEEMYRFLPGDENGSTPTGPNVTMTKSVRLAVLDAWTFFSTGETAGFVDRLMALNGRTSNGDDAENTNLRLDAPGTTPPVSTALAMGYVPLDHDLRDGGNTVSWYRGPLSPNDVAQPDADVPVASPDQVTVFDPTTGMLDVSLAAAWTIGRLIALQDTTYASSLYNWKKGLSQQVVDSIEHEIIDDVFGGLLELAPPPAVAPASRNKRLLHHTMRLLPLNGGRR